MKTQSDFVNTNKLLKGRITLIRFNMTDKRRTNTYSGISLPVLLDEIASSSRFGGLTYKMFVDLPSNLDNPPKLTTEWQDSVESYELNLYI